MYRPKVGLSLQCSNAQDRSVCPFSVRYTKDRTVQCTGQRYVVFTVRILRTSLSVPSVFAVLRTGLYNVGHTYVRTFIVRMLGTGLSVS